MAGSNAMRETAIPTLHMSKTGGHTSISEKIPWCYLSFLLLQQLDLSQVEKTPIALDKLGFQFKVQIHLILYMIYTCMQYQQSLQRIVKFHLMDNSINDTDLYSVYERHDQNHLFKN